MGIRAFVGGTRRVTPARLADLLRELRTGGGHGRLGTDDLDAQATAAWRLGRCKESVRLAEHVFKQLSRSDPSAAAMKAVDVAHTASGQRDLAAGDIATAESICRQLGVEPPRISALQSPAGLTRREIDVLTAIARGATNRQVAEELFIGDKTVGRHLANIYAKLGVSSRTAAVSWAYANRVVDSAGRPASESTAYIVCTISATKNT